MHALLFHLLWKSSPFSLQGKFPFSQVIGENLFFLLDAFLRRSEISSGGVAPTFLFSFSNYNEAFLVWRLFM